MSAEIISFDPLVALRAKWDALDAQCTQLDERGEDRRRMSSACQWSRSRTALPRWCQCRPVAQRFELQQFGRCVNQRRCGLACAEGLVGNNVFQKRNVRLNAANSEFA